ncbi:hypothetical protein [Sporosarcina sp.]|nr:hypothetical protein [Sporosarcina sp.]
MVECKEASRCDSKWMTYARLASGETDVVNPLLIVIRSPNMEVKLVRRT